VDLFDAKTNTLSGPQKNDEKLDKVVEKMIKEFPPR
jgi:hypothetical protein